MSGRVYERKFDWDEARNLREQGYIYAEIGRRLGVSAVAVNRVCNPQLDLNMRMRMDAWQRSGVCVDCGGPCSRMSGSGRRVLRCKDCASEAAATSVREQELLCFRCKIWKSDADFPKNAHESHAHRRFRHSLCRACQTVARREYRQRNREKEAAYSREYKRRRRALA